MAGKHKHIYGERWTEQRGWIAGNNKTMVLYKLNFKGISSFKLAKTQAENSEKIKQILLCNLNI